MLEKYNLSKALIVIIASTCLVVIAIFITVLSLQIKQNTKSKASPQSTYEAIDVTDTTGKALDYQDNNGIRTYTTQSLDVKIKINDLEKLGGE